MPSTQRDPDEQVPLIERRPVKWDAVAAIIASLVGFLALLVAGYTAYVQRYTAQIQNKQVQAQVWPHLHIAQSTFPPSIYVVNQGVGPAIIRSVEVLVDGKPQPDWDHVFAAIGMRGDINTQGPAMGGYVLTPGHVANWLNFEFTRDQYQSFLDAIKAAPTGNILSKSPLREMSYEVFEGRQRVLFRQFLAGAKRSRLQVRICYCSTLGDCRLATWAVGQRERQTQECKAVPVADQIRQ
jgi:hypothetical protein